MMPPGAKFIQFKKMVYDGINGGYLEYEQTAIRLDFEITTNMSQYIFIYNQKLYTLNCNIIGQSNEYGPISKKKFSKLFDLVANSIVVNQQYKK